MSVFEHIADKVREVAREEAARSGVDIRRFEVTRENPLTLKAIDGSGTLREGDDDLELAAVAKSAVKGDVVLVVTDPNGDYIAVTMMGDLIATGGVPSGPAGGVLSGTYPDPAFAADMATQAELNAAIATRQAAAEKNTANGYAGLGADAKLPTSLIPALATTEVYTVASQAAQLALVAQRGDVAVRTDQHKSYIHNGGSAATMADWTVLDTPIDAVTAVNGQIGTVNLGASDVGAQPVDSDLTAIAALATTSFGRSLLTQADAAAARSALGIAPETWHEVGAAGEPAFANGWVNFGSTYGTAAFRKDPFGTVHLKGMVKSGTLGSNVYVLPVGYRPAAQGIFAAIGNNAVARIDVAPDGGVAVSASIGSSTWTTLNGITFRAAG